MQGLNRGGGNPLARVDSTIKPEAGLVGGSVARAHNLPLLYIILLLENVNIVLNSADNTTQTPKQQHQMTERM